MSQKGATLETGMIRQGDILLVPIHAFPFEGDLRNHQVSRNRDKEIIVAEGEVTGHHHKIATDRVQRYRQGGQFFLKVANKDGAELEHDEHDTLTIPPGKYRIEHQREYKPQAAPVRVYD